MAFIKQQWKLLAIGFVAAASIGIAAWQFMAADQVTASASDVVKLGNSVKNLSQVIPRASWISAIEQAIKENEDKLKGSVNAVELRQQFNPSDGVDVPRKPLVEGVLPEPQSTTVRAEFKRVYRDAFDAMIATLSGGQPPTAQQLQQATIAAEDARLAMERDDPWLLVRPSAEIVPTGAGDFDRGIELWKNPQVRLSYEMARRIRMYVDTKSIARHSMANRDEAPSEIDIWQAQMLLWVQQDVTRALAQVNADEAKSLVEAGEADKDWVAYMPVKRLIWMKVEPWALGNGEHSTEQDGTGPLINVNMERSFTRRENNDKRFVVPVYIEMVIAMKDLPKILSAICDSSLITPVHLDYDMVPPSWDQIGYVFGPEPCVQLKLHVEAYYLHSVYGPFMPNLIKSHLRKAISALKQSTEGGFRS